MNNQWKRNEKVYPCKLQTKVKDVDPSRESKVPPLFFSIYFDFQKLLGQKKQFFEWVWVIACLACMFSVNLGVQILPKFQNFSEFFPYNNEHYTFLA